MVDNELYLKRLEKWYNFASYFNSSEEISIFIYNNFNKIILEKWIEFRNLFALDEINTVLIPFIYEKLSKIESSRAR